MLSPDDGVTTSQRYTEILLREPTYEGARDKSVFTVADFVSPADCATLVDAANECIAGRLATEEPQTRYRLATPTAATGLDRKILSQLFSLLETQIPELAKSLFGTATQVDLADMLVQFSPGEPAVNVYKAGGDFKPHTDKQSLTILVPLSPSGAFEGGGTAFWPESHHPSAAQRGTDYDELDEGAWLPPCRVLREPAGSAIVFGGSVTHSGLPTLSGTRHLFVMSFTLRPRA